VLSRAAFSGFLFRRKRGIMVIAGGVFKKDLSVRKGAAAHDV